MNAILRRLAEWRGRRKGAQIVFFDGAAEIDRTRSFAKGAVFGALFATAAVAITAPTTVSPRMLDEIERRQALVTESQQRAAQAIQVADVCLTTAQNLERTLAAYQAFLGGDTRDLSVLPAAD